MCRPIFIWNCFYFTYFWVISGCSFNCFLVLNVTSTSVYKAGKFSWYDSKVEFISHFLFWLCFFTLNVALLKMNFSSCNRQTDIYMYHIVIKNTVWVSRCGSLKTLPKNYQRSIMLMDCYHYQTLVPTLSSRWMTSSL